MIANPHKKKSPRWAYRGHGQRDGNEYVHPHYTMPELVYTNLPDPAVLADFSDELLLDELISRMKGRIEAVRSLKGKV